MTDELKAEREAFEDWMLDEGEAYFGKSDFRIGEAGEYECMEIYAAWIAWHGAWQARAKLDRTHTTGGDGDE